MMMRVAFVVLGLFATLMTTVSIQASAPRNEVDFLAVAADITRMGDAAMTRYEPNPGMDTADVFSDI